MSGPLQMSTDQIEKFRHARQLIREAQMECLNIDHPFYPFCDELMGQIDDALDAEEET